ncbi:VTC domain-containing protein [Eggerthellaceae bacterium zg-886]|uniref:VTC domain-containing protein n=2 Tax=Xiamenia xianingshaonis TaxID=2682776 RepID=A0ABX0IGU6_9ACTN|nr:VTC domain-containing protein [Xiamenia xianingshaonis]
MSPAPIASPVRLDGLSAAVARSASQRSSPLLLGPPGARAAHRRMSFLGRRENAMTIYAEVFERKEVKYLVSSEQRACIERGATGRMEVDAFGKSRVTSLYYDTPDHLLIERSLDKPCYKEKLRVRWYGPAGADGFPRPDVCVFVELKKKFKGIVYKRRVSCTFAAAHVYLAGCSYEAAVRAYPLADEAAQQESLSPLSCQIAREIDAFMKRHGPLVPSMLVTCLRTAFTPVLAHGEARDAGHQDDVRITFDEDIAARDLMQVDAAWQEVSKSGQSVMEVKVAGPYGRWLLDAVAQAGARPTSFSKYGRAYRDLMEARRRESAARLGAAASPKAAAASSASASSPSRKARSAWSRLFPASVLSPRKKEKHCA